MKICWPNIPQRGGCQVPPGHCGGFAGADLRICWVWQPSRRRGESPPLSGRCHSSSRRRLACVVNSPGLPKSDATSPQIKPEFCSNVYMNKLPTAELKLIRRLVQQGAMHSFDPSRRHYTGSETSHPASNGVPTLRLATCHPHRGPTSNAGMPRRGRRHWQESRESRAAWAAESGIEKQMEGWKVHQRLRDYLRVDIPPANLVDPYLPLESLGARMGTRSHPTPPGPRASLPLVLLGVSS
jgi:hypothetical protein